MRSIPRTGAPTLPGYLRPIYVGVAMAMAAEVLIFVVWGLLLAPGGGVVAKAVWASTCGAAMGLALGLAVDLLVLGRLSGRSAVLTTALISYVLLAACTTFCFFLDHHHDLWGGITRPWLFLVFGYLPAVKFSLAYGWLLFSDRGARVLAGAEARLGLWPEEALRPPRRTPL